MRTFQTDPSAAKGWLDGPWLTELPIAVGFANAALDEAHEHATITEIFMVGRGTATARVEDRSIELDAGDVLVVEPGEVRAIEETSTDRLIFVVHVPGSDGALGQDKRVVP